MGRQFFTSDHHFGHRQILFYEAKNRPFDDIRVMDDYMTIAWNKIVSPEDTVYYLGDFALTPKERKREILQSLNGRKILVLGNHDASKASMLEVGFDEVHHWLVMKMPMEDRDRRVLLIHDPARFIKGFENGNGFDYIFCGHVHSNWKTKKNAVNVGVDQWVFRPIDVQTVVGALGEEIPAVDLEVIRKPSGKGSTSLELHMLAEVYGKTEL